MFETFDQLFNLIIEFGLLIFVIGYCFHIANMRFIYNRLKKEDRFYKSKGVKK